MPEFNETAEEQRNRIAALLMLATDQPAHSPTASDAITMGSPSGNTQIALSELSDPDAVNGPSLGPIMGPAPDAPAPSGRNSDLDRQADQTLADMAIGWGMPSSSIDITLGAPGAFDMSGPPGDYGGLPSFDGMGFGVPGLSDFSPSPGPIGPGGALADPGAGGFAAGFAQGFDMASAAPDGSMGDGGVGGVGDGAGAGMGGSEGSGSSSDSGGASGSSGVG